MEISACDGDENMRFAGKTAIVTGAARAGMDWREPRISRSCPSHSSNAFTCWLTAFWLTPSSAAAVEKLVWRTTASNVRRAD